MLIYFSKNIFDTLLECQFKESGNVSDIIPPIEVSVEELEDLIEGYQNAFKEEEIVKISIQIDNIYDVLFDETFGNIPFKAEATITFTNPIEERFSSAQAKLAFKGIAELTVKEDLSFAFQVSQEQLRVSKLQSFFMTETSMKEFESEFKKKFPK